MADESGEIVDSFNLPNWFVATLRGHRHGRDLGDRDGCVHGRKSAVGSDRAWEPDRRAGVERGVHGLRSDCRQRRPVHPRLERERASRRCDGDIRQHQPHWNQGGKPEHIAHRRHDRRDASRDDDVHRHGRTTVELPRERQPDGHREPGGREVGRRSRGRAADGHAHGRNGRKRHLFGHREPERRNGNGVHRQPERDRPARGRDRIVQPEHRQLCERGYVEDLDDDDHHDIGGSRRRRRPSPSARRTRTPPATSPRATGISSSALPARRPR